MIVFVALCIVIGAEGGFCPGCYVRDSAWRLHTSLST